MLSRIVSLGLFLALLGLATECCAAKKKGNGKKNNSQASAKAQIAALEAELSRAKAQHHSATERMSAAQIAQSQAHQLVENAKSGILGAKSTYLGAKKSMQQLERGLEVNAPAEYQKLSGEFEAAQAKLRQEQDRVLNSPDYKAAHEKALNSLDKSELLPRVRQEALARDKGYQDALQEYNRLSATLSPQRMELFKQDGQWAQEAATASKASVDTLDQENRLQSSLMTQFSATNSVRKASALASAAQQVIQATEAKLGPLKKQVSAAAKKKPN